MKMSEYWVLSNKIEKADEIMGKKYELNIWIKHFKDVINGKQCVYERSKDSRRFPTPKEIEKANSDLVIYKQKIKVLNTEFAAI